MAADWQVCIGWEMTSSSNIFAGSVQELQGDLDGAVASYEQAIRHNNWSVPAMQAISNIYRAKDQFGHAIDYLRTILKIDATNGEVWGSLGSYHPALLRPISLTLLDRPLLSHDGQSPRGILRLPAGSLPSPKSKGTRSV